MWKIHGEYPSSQSGNETCWSKKAKGGKGKYDGWREVNGETKQKEEADGTA